MAVSRAMRRLLNVLEMQEEQGRAALESAIAELRRLERALNASHDRDRAGRRRVTASVCTGELVDRLAGIEETLAASRYATVLKPKIALADLAVSARRAEFLARRIERRQAETIKEKIEAGEAIEVGRRTQREADVWFLNGNHRAADSGEKR